jgi:hypothetical protein
MVEDSYDRCGQLPLQDYGLLAQLLVQSAANNLAT